MNITPRQMRRRAIYVTAAGAGGALLVMLDWWQHWWLPAERPFLALMVYALFLGTAIGGAITSAAAACHLAVGRAFAAGMNAGRMQVDGPNRGHGLRLVE